MSDSAWQGNNGRDKSDIQPSPPRVPVTPATPDVILQVNEAGRVVITPRHSEFESLRRTLYNALDKLDQLERRVTVT